MNVKNIKDYNDLINAFSLQEKEVERINRDNEIGFIKYSKYKNIDMQFCVYKQQEKEKCEIIINVIEEYGTDKDDKKLYKVCSGYKYETNFLRKNLIAKIQKQIFYKYKSYEKYKNFYKKLLKRIFLFVQMDFVDYLKDPNELTDEELNIGDFMGFNDYRKKFFIVAKKNKVEIQKNNDEFKDIFLGRINTNIWEVSMSIILCSIIILVYHNGYTNWIIDNIIQIFSNGEITYFKTIFFCITLILISKILVKIIYSLMQILIIKDINNILAYCKNNKEKQPRSLIYKIFKKAYPFIK